MLKACIFIRITQQLRAKLHELGCVKYKHAAWYMENKQKELPGCLRTEKQMYENQKDLTTGP